MSEAFPDDWADVYDDYATGLPGELGFYLAEAAKAEGEILEIACGTGRILIPIAESGKTVTGIDLAPSMLKVCREKVAKLPADVQERITVVDADMRRFDLGRRFALVICPYRAFLHNLTSDDQLATLACVRAHLAPGGRFVMNFFDPKLELIAARIGEENAGEHELFRSYFDSANGRQVNVYEKRWYDPVDQIINSHLKFAEKLDSGRERLKTTKSLKLRWIYRHEMEHLFARAGFEVVSLFGNFDRGPFDYGLEQVWIVKKNLTPSPSTGGKGSG